MIKLLLFRLGKMMFCPLPFIHLSVEPDGSVSPCCNTSANVRLGNTKQSSLSEILESKELEEFRALFSNDEKPLPQQCYQCSKVEAAGNMSLRQSSLRVFEENVENDIKVPLRYLGLRFDNICNLKCRICFPDLSTTWVSDYKKLGRVVKEERIQAFSTREDLIYQTSRYIKTITHLYIAGGEPFLSPRFYDLIEEIKRQDRQGDIELILNTNATVVEFQGKSIEDYLRGFKSVSLGLSIDGVGERAGYMRHGFCWRDFDRTIRTYQSWNSVDVYMSPTISNLNFYYLPELFDYCLKDLKLSPLALKLSPLFEPNYFHISQYPEELKKETQCRLLEYGLALFDNKRLKPIEARSLFQQIKAMINLSKPTFNRTVNEDFKREISLIDELRGESFSKTFPELSILLKT